MDKLGVGLISCGVMGSGLARALKGVATAELRAVSDINEEAAWKLAADWVQPEGEEEGPARPPLPVHTDYQELLARPDVAAVIVASPQFLHADMTVAAAAAGKHVFCEKPMATNVADCDRMIAAVERAGVKLMIGQVCRFHAVHATVKKLVDEGTIGEPTCLMVHRIGGGWGGGWRQPWRLKQAQSGGNLMEINAHELDFLRWVCGEVKQVYAQGGNYITPEIDYPDLTLVTLTFASGAVGFLHSSQATLFGGYGGRLDATEGSAEFPSFWGEGAGVRYRHKDAEETTFLPASEMQVENPVQHELRVWVEAILNDTTPPVTGYDGRAAVEIAEAAYRSMETGQPVSLPL